MTSPSPWRLSGLFGPATWSLEALAYFTPIGLLLVLLTIPEDVRVGVTSPAWWAIALASQAAFLSVVALGGLLFRRVAERRRASFIRLSVILVAGASRGLLVGLAIDALDPPDAPSNPLVLRCVISAAACALGMLLIGLLLQARRDYADDYRVLLERAVAVQRAQMDEDSGIAPEVLEQWSAIQHTVRTASQRMHASFDSSDAVPSGANLAAASAVVAETVAQGIRPVSHSLWFAGSSRVPRLRTGALILDSLSDWSLPLGEIAIVLGVIAGVGAVCRAGLVVGVGFTLFLVASTFLILFASTKIASRIPGPAVGIGTLLLMPGLLLVIAVAIGQHAFHVTADNGGAAIAALGASVVTFEVLLLHRASGERRSLLEALQARIDHGVVVLRARQDARRESEKVLGAYVHHTIQSELSAIGIALERAAHADDAGDRVAARSTALRRISHMENAPAPWTVVRSGREHIDDVIRSWEGIATIAVGLPPAERCRPDQWKLASQAIEESIANSVRAGGASLVTISGSAIEGVLRLEIVDNGTASKAASVSGLGSAWLDHNAPGAWSFQQGDFGAYLRVDFV